MSLLERWWRKQRPTRPPIHLNRPAIDPTKVDPAAIRAFFNDAAASEEHYPSTIDERILFVKRLLEHLAPAISETAAAGKVPLVADIGCGKGRFARVLARHQPTVRIVAVDLAEAMLAPLTSSDPGNDRVFPVAASMTALPLATAAYDGAYAIESLEHAIDASAAVSELTRIVRPGGRIMILDKNAEAWGRLETPNWEQWFEAQQLNRLLSQYCSQVICQPISYWEDVEPDGLFLSWLAVK